MMGILIQLKVPIISIMSTGPENSCHFGALRAGHCACKALWSTAGFQFTGKLVPGPPLAQLTAALGGCVSFVALYGTYKDALGGCRLNDLPVL